MATKNPKTTTVVKKRMTKKIKVVERVVSVPAEVAFWTVDGQVFHSLHELASGLQTMEGRVYRYHADSDYQDFAKWVGGVFHDKATATLLKAAKTPKAAAKIITTALKGQSH